MIIYWLQWLLYRVKWLLVYPEAHELARIDPNAPCPVCGNRKGHLKFIILSERGPAATAYTPLCEHICDMCEATWTEKPIVKAEPDRVRPASIASVRPKGDYRS